MVKPEVLFHYHRACEILETWSSHSSGEIHGNKILDINAEKNYPPQRGIGNVGSASVLRKCS